MLRILHLAFLPLSAWLLLEPGFAAEKKAQTIKGWGTVVDPDGDCKITENKDKVTMAVPGTHHNLTYGEDYTKLNSPRILQSAMGDFVLQVKVQAFPIPETSGEQISFTSGGLLVWQDSKNFIRWERATVGESAERFVTMQRFQDGKSVSFKKKAVADKDIELRVNRSGNKLTFSVSEDGNWDDVQTEEVELVQKVQVGVLAINTTAKVFSAQLEGLKLKAK
jgi:regulation of enolase protein 1 (concanavalin A-like superfamily)